MSKVLGRAEENRKRIPPEIVMELEKKRLSQVMRRQTWPDHERAEYSDFEQALVNATVSREGYRELLAQSWYIYCALEERIEELSADPVAGPVLFPELPRKDCIERDLGFYYGPDWRDQVAPLPLTQEYVERIRNSTPAQFVAHHYTRYLADLSGGLVIRDALRQGWKLDGDGIRYYEFPGIPDPVAFKKNYRATLDALPVDAEEKRGIIAEVLVAYEYNIELVQELAKRYPVPKAAARDANQGRA